jgi:hypothetical protein
MLLTSKQQGTQGTQLAFRLDTGSAVGKIIEAESALVCAQVERITATARSSRTIGTVLDAPWRPSHRPRGEFSEEMASHSFRRFGGKKFAHFSLNRELERN